MFEDWLPKLVYGGGFLILFVIALSNFISAPPESRVSWGVCLAPFVLVILLFVVVYSLPNKK